MNFSVLLDELWRKHNYINLYVKAKFLARSKGMCKRDINNQRKKDFVNLHRAQVADVRIDFKKVIWSIMWMTELPT